MIPEPTGIFIVCFSSCNHRKEKSFCSRCVYFFSCLKLYRTKMTAHPAKSAFISMFVCHLTNHFSLLPLQSKFIRIHDTVWIQCFFQSFHHLECRSILFFHKSGQFQPDTVMVIDHSTVFHCRPDSCIPYLIM